MYQVMIRKQHGATWETYAAPTGDPFVAMRHLQQAKGTHAEVTVVQATTASELALLVDRMKHRDCTETWSTGAAIEQQPAQPSHEALLDERHRWAMEQGPGGDHDEPYHFELPASARVTRAWIQLMARRIREEQDAEPAA
ncbi:MAG: hypothetical protein ACRDHP_14995 [Ktedonobacterales bacterium]